MSWEINQRVYDKIREDCVNHFEENFFINPTGCKWFESPIEEIMYWAVSGFCLASNIETKNHIDVEHLGWVYPGEGEYVLVWPQKQIKGYRVDFYIEYFLVNETGPSSAAAIVECDGREFHHGNEILAARDKARDRDLAPEVRFIFRYTGKEIHRDPFSLALQIVEDLHEAAFDNPWRLNDVI